jgi:hypothetical protein
MNAVEIMVVFICAIMAALLVAVLFIPLWLLGKWLEAEKNQKSIPSDLLTNMLLFICILSSIPYAIYDAVR